ncbi:MAG: F0F1 ATP synthase subunit B' [Hyphomicrobiales bacterium]|nr:F0F1 ATP synthase subunit B' [Hyphomicrobiales bacterium]
MADKKATPITAIEHIPASEHGPGFPPFNPETFASQLVWLVLVFGALYLLMSRLALPRIAHIMNARRQSVENDLAEAGRLKEASDAAIATYEKALADARGRAQALANETRERYAAEAAAARRELDAALNARIAEAEQTIAARRAAAMTNVQDIAIETATTVVERLTGQAPASAEVAQAVAATLKR